jgi:hypothetical protein
MPSLDHCPEELPPELAALVESFGRAWAASPIRPRPTASTLAKWEKLIDAWSQADDMPLFIRKHSNNRGSAVFHSSGRLLVPTDNSPAHWAYVVASSGECPSLDDIRSMLVTDSIPVVMIQKGVEKPLAKYHCFLRKQFNVNLFGWKLAHVKAVGLNTRVPLAELSIERLLAHFRSLISPANMFVVPLAWSGLAEVQSVIKAVASQADETPDG